MKRRLPPLGLSLLVAIVYFAGAELGLSLATLHQNVTPVWPPTGIAIAALLVFGGRVWPGVFIGALAANLPTSISVASAFGIATGNTLEAVVAWFLLQRSKRWAKSFDSVGDVLIFIVYASVLAPLVSASIGSLSICLGDPNQWNRFARLWLTWWMGDGFGALIVSPFLLSWSSSRKIDRRDIPELIGLFVILLIVVLIVFGGWFPGPVKTYPLAYLCLPCLLWAAVKFDQRIVTSSIVLMAALAVWGAKHNYGPFIQPSANVTLLLLTSFVGTAALMTLLVAAVTTERRKAEAEKWKLASELERRRTDLLKRESHAREQAEEASRLKEEFLATVSHELRTPLNAVVGWSRLLRSGQLDNDGVSHAVEVIERNAAAQRQIIEDLLDVSRIVAGKLRISTQPVDLLLVIHGAIDAMRPAAEAREIKINTHVEAPDSIVRADAERLQQVFWNLLANAVKFTPHGGVIDIYLECHDSLAEIRIEDSGPGVPPEFLPHIFERFSQADGSSTRKHGGLGLGLAIVRHLVELHGGTVSATNRGAEGGAILTVRLPAMVGSLAQR
ncbi:MAG TPA: MASE1 domain-containing protein [Pyrinomonadaceae bacterium]|jgi:signal transduction histidine kinase|nr:MASE1 domain-containing protein [Pyrinomonadaceae bacterium]